MHTAAATAIAAPTTASTMATTNSHSHTDDRAQLGRCASASQLAHSSARATPGVMFGVHASEQQDVLPLHARMAAGLGTGAAAAPPVTCCVQLCATPSDALRVRFAGTPAPARIAAALTPETALGWMRAALVAAERVDGARTLFFLDEVRGHGGRFVVTPVRVWWGSRECTGAPRAPRARMDAYPCAQRLDALGVRWWCEEYTVREHTHAARTLVLVHLDT